MESLYAKLYEKYDRLKKRKFSELDEISKDQEVKFMNYVTAAEELIEYLRSENDNLRNQVNSLKTEIDSIRSGNNERCLEYQKLLLEENQKNKALSEEVERLQKLHQEGNSSWSKDGKIDNQPSTPGSVRTTSLMLPSGSAQRKTRKRLRKSPAAQEGGLTFDRSDQDDAVVRELDTNISKETLSSGELVYSLEPVCCKRNIDKSGAGVNDSGPAVCLFQALIEYLVGIKLSAHKETDRICILVLHQSSGYCFSLTWVKGTAGEEEELLYRVLSLGTLERVALEWMREEIMFSKNMCPLFFERIARVIKLHH